MVTREQMYSAIAIVGGKPRWEISNMHHALRLHSWLNTDEENARYEACDTILHHWSMYRDLTVGMSAAEIRKAYPRED